MRYTRQIPLKEGYYFKRHRDPDEPPACSTEKIVYVSQVESQWRVAEVKGSIGNPLSLYAQDRTEWAGPIQEPEN